LGSFDTKKMKCGAGVIPRIEFHRGGFHRTDFPRIVQSILLYPRHVFTAQY
jgi:hypothetical protein